MISVQFNEDTIVKFSVWFREETIVQRPQHEFSKQQAYGVYVLYVYKPPFDYSLVSVLYALFLERD